MKFLIFSAFFVPSYWGIRFAEFNRVHRVISRTQPNLPSFTELYRISTDFMLVSYLVSISTQFGPSRLRIDQVVPDLTMFLNPGLEA